MSMSLSFFHFAFCMSIQLNSSPMSWGVGAYKVGGAGQCSSMRRSSPWQPCKRPPPGTVTLNNSVEYLPTHYLLYLAPTSRGREGWEKPKHKLAHKQQAIVITLCEELQGSNCVYKSQGAPARGTPSIPGENC